ncbi:MAG: ribbon-helix-helix protein, CopG family [Oscillospiraceae bacterium]|nr:ribbon-helix-helix protein, CopG family [Oscillospiraceae bacterium]
MTEKNRISTFLDDETTKALKERANKEGRSVSNLIGFIIKQYLEHEHEHEQKGK